MPSHPLAAALSLAMLTTAAPRPAHAAESTRDATVIDISAEDKAHTRIAHEVRAAVAEHEDFELAPVHGALNAGAESDGRSNVKTAQAFYKAGLAALEAGDAMDAADQLDSAARLMENSLALVPDVDEYRRLLLHLGAARFRSGEAAPAGLTFERAVLFRADPGMVILEAPERALYEQAREAVEERPLGAVTFETDPPHAALYVDGRFRGVTPTTVAGLPEGEHVLSIYKDGWARKTATVEVSSLGLVKESVALEPARRKRLFDDLRQALATEVDDISEPGDEAGEGVRQVRSLLYADAAVVVRASGDESSKQVDLFLFDTRSRFLVHRVTGTVDWSRRDREAVRALTDRLLSADWREVLARAGSDPDPVASEPVTKKWWFWTVLGVGVAGAATAGALIATSGDGDSSPDSGSVVLTF